MTDELAAAWEAGARLALSKACAPIYLYGDVLAANPHLDHYSTCDVCLKVKPASEFVPRPWAPTLHSKTCVDCKAVERAERDERRAERTEARRRERCPHPDKRVHKTKAEALEHIQSLYKAGRGNPDYRPYLCECGAWHVGHDKFRLATRARAAMRRTR